MFFKLLIFTAFLAFGVTQDNFKVLREQEYFRKILAAFAKNLEEVGVSNTEILPMKDFTLYVNENSDGFTVQGNTTFTQGFIIKIKEIPEPYLHKLRQHEVKKENATIYFAFDMNQIYVSYLIELTDFPELKDRYGNVELILNDAKFIAGINQNFMTKEIEATVEFETFSKTVAGTGARAFPYHQTMQMVLKSLKRGQLTGIQNSMRKWNLSPLLQKAAEKVPFPELCYHCDGYMIDN